MAPPHVVKIGSSTIGMAAPGSLVVLGFVLIALSASFGKSLPEILLYASVGTGILISLCGVVLQFREAGAGTVAEIGTVASSDIEEAVGQLGKNYDILRRQVTQGFILAGTFMALGISVILIGSLGDMFGFTKSTSNLTTIAGVIVEVVSGLGLYLFKETFKQLNLTSDKLYDMWKLLTAFRRTGDLPEDRRADVMVALITKLADGITVPARSNQV
jgi:hypothetical protein